MTTADDLLRRALEVLDEKVIGYEITKGSIRAYLNAPKENEFAGALKDLNQSFAESLQPEQDEPVAWRLPYIPEPGMSLVTQDHEFAKGWSADNKIKAEPLYLHPPTKTAPKDEPVAWPINGDTAKRIAEKQCVSYEVVQLIAREILNLHPPTKTAPQKPMTVEEMKEAWGQPGHLSTAVLIAYTRAIERHHGIGGGDE